MKKRSIFILLIVTILLFIYSKSPFAQPIYPLYEMKCGRCHIAYLPTDYPADDWNGIVRSMKSNAALSNAEMTEIVEYLEANASEGESRHSKGGPNLGGYLYTEYFKTDEKAKNFDLHYLAIYVSGWMNDNISYLGEFEFEHGGTGGNNAFVEQAYFDYSLFPDIAIRIGAMLTPFNRFDEFHDPLTNLLITRPQVSREIGVSAWKDVGVDLHGYYNFSDDLTMMFDLYTINGLGSGANMRGSRQYRDNNEDLAKGGRLNFIYNDMIEVGGSMYKGAWDNDGDYDLSLFGAHFMFTHPLVNLYGEFLSAASENPAGFDDGEMSGYFIQASHLFDRKYRPTVRFGNLDYLDLYTDPIPYGGRKATDKQVNELALGMNYYPNSKVVFKFEYTIFTAGDRLNTDGSAKKDDNQIGLQAAIKF